MKKRCEYDITLIDVPVKSYSVEDMFARKLNAMYAVNDLIFQNVTGHRLEEKKYYYSSGLLCISSYLKSRDLNVGYINYPKDQEKLQEMVCSSRFVGFSTVTITINEIFELAQTVKKWNPQVTVILGGYHAPFCAEDLLKKQSYIDGIILGEGEIPIYQMLSGKPYSEVKGLCYKKNTGEIVINTETEFLKEDEIPAPDFSLIEDDINDYNIYIGTMRGCIGRCNFCINHTYWGKPRFISLDKIAETFRYLDEKIKDPRLIHIIDNVFTFNKDRLKKICDILQPYKAKFSFECDTLASLVDEESVCLLEKMNIIKIGLGFEDCVDDICKKANKMVRISDNINAAKMIGECSPNICVYAYWLIGLPGTTEETIIENQRMAKELISEGIVHIISPKIFIPYPGTVFWEQREKFGLVITSENWNDYERISPPYPYYLDGIDEAQLEMALQKMVDICITAYIDRWNLTISSSDIKKYNTWYENEPTIK